jgi:TPP-dependent pyruvate/acetoin dehydrogenase alpha subunit
VSDFFDMQPNLYDGQLRDAKDKYRQLKRKTAIAQRLDPISRARTVLKEFKQEQYLQTKDASNSSRRLPVNPSLKTAASPT